MSLIVIEDKLKKILSLSMNMSQQNSRGHTTSANACKCPCEDEAGHAFGKSTP
jgi:hypothetical protein